MTNRLTIIGTVGVAAIVVASAWLQWPAAPASDRTVALATPSPIATLPAVTPVPTDGPPLPAGELRPPVEVYVQPAPTPSPTATPLPSPWPTIKPIPSPWPTPTPDPLPLPTVSPIPWPPCSGCGPYPVQPGNMQPMIACPMTTMAIYCE
ncbi:MAG TPA: hypothetical protein VLF67_02765 [Candidatus Saccharimonas sp.]|nr:hypothetical protein [Candidatus Saccharimonas sp.]